MSPKQSQWIVIGAIYDTGSNVLYSVGLLLLLAGKMAYIRNTRTLMGENQNKPVGISSSTMTLSTSKFYLHIGARVFSVIFTIVPRPSPLIIWHKDLDSMGLSCQIYQKAIGISEDVYKEDVEMRNCFPFMLFPNYALLSSSQL